MSKAVLPFHLFPNIAWWQQAHKAETIQIDIHENWVKQTNRSRFDIVGANGVQQLSIPTIKRSRRTLKDVEISYAENWPVLHWRSITSAYNRSPYFEYYGYAIEQLFENRPKYLIDLNLKALEWCYDKLQLPFQVELSESYIEETEIDFRSREIPYNPIEYYQVFDEKLGFQPNLSVLDVLFNCGPESAGLFA
jgi:hypothetical protein